MHQQYPYRSTRNYPNSFGRRNQFGYNNNQNLGNFLIGGALGYGLGYFTPRPPVFYQPFPPFSQPYPIQPYRPFFW